MDISSQTATGINMWKCNILFKIRFILSLHCRKQSMEVHRPTSGLWIPQGTDKALAQH